MILREIHPDSSHYENRHKLIGKAYVLYKVRYIEHKHYYSIHINIDNNRRVIYGAYLEHAGEPFKVDPLFVERLVSLCVRYKTVIEIKYLKQLKTREDTKSMIEKMNYYV